MDTTRFLMVLCKNPYLSLKPSMEKKLPARKLIRSSAFLLKVYRVQQLPSPG